MVDFYPLVVESILEFKTEYKIIMAKNNSKDSIIININRYTSSDNTIR